MQMRFPSAVLLTCLFSATVSTADETLLRLSWEPGQRYVWETITEMVMTNPAAGEASAQETMMSQVITVTVRQDTAKHKLARVDFTHTKGTVGMMGQTLSYDSADPAKSPPLLQQTFGALAGKSFTLVYDQDDRFIETRDGESLRDTPLGEGRSLSGAQLADYFRQSHEGQMPPRPVKPGGTWNRQQALAVPPLGTITLDGTARLKDIITGEEGKLARIMWEGVCTTSPPDDASQVFELDESSRFSCETTFDMSQKIVRQSVMQSNLLVQMPGGNLQLQQTVTTRLVSKEDADASP